MKAPIILNGVGLILGFVATVFLYLASTEMPWSMQSWKGETPAEQAFRRKRRNQAKTGFVLLALAFLSQLIALAL